MLCAVFRFLCKFNAVCELSYTVKTKQKMTAAVPESKASLPWSVLKPLICCVDMMRKAVVTTIRPDSDFTVQRLFAKNLRLHLSRGMWQICGLTTDFSYFDVRATLPLWTRPRNCGSITYRTTEIDTPLTGNVKMCRSRDRPKHFAGLGVLNNG